MDFLWSPWRYRYVSGALGAGTRQDCVFCRILGADVPDRQSLVLYRAEHNFVILNRYPYTSGHMMVVPYEHVAKLAAASPEAASEMIELTRRIECVLDRLYRPDGVNVGMNIGRAAGAGVADHIHMHALPRWAADSNFATVIGETRVLPEALEVTWERARAEFERP
ncbi:MAG: HIT domain-containing protein [Bryobacterales bacterium]|nr:HIT domain-containing protein [Bryobacterales bacterium]